MNASEFIRQYPKLSPKDVMLLAKKQGVQIPSITRIYGVRYNDRESGRKLRKPVAATLPKLQKIKRAEKAPKRIRSKPKLPPSVFQTQVDDLIETLVQDVLEQAIQRIREALVP
jgi:hypothetical protein